MLESYDEKTIESVDGITIAYRVNNIAGSKQFELFHPPSSMNRTSLEALEILYNGAGKSSINFDPRGTGKSDKPDSYHSYDKELYVEDVKAIIKAEGIEQFSFVAYDAGFMTAVEYAVANEGVTHIHGLTPPYAFKESTKFPLIAEFMDNSLVRILGESFGRGMGQIQTLFSKKLSLYPEFNEYVNKSDFSLFLAMMNVPLDEQRAHILSGRNMFRWNIVDALQKNTTPLSLVYGSNDIAVVPEVGDCINELSVGPVRIAVLEGGSHSFPVTKPRETFNQKLDPSLY